MIRPGLEVIARLMKDVPLSWKAIHVAGTNGKGSTSTFLSALLYKSGLKTGRFNSPHLIDKWDCISVNESSITKRTFDAATGAVMRRNDVHKMDASEFEILTATAFEVFERERVDVAVVECGMGGLEDATNVLKSPLLTMITRIGLDHQGFLGDTLAKIATQKAGILKTGVPCIVDASSCREALDAIREVAAIKDVPYYFVPSSVDGLDRAWTETQANFHRQAQRAFDEEEELSLLPLTHRVNMAMAIEAYTVALPLFANLKVPDSAAALVQSVAKHHCPPGRFQKIDISSINGGVEVECTLDGAHNPQAWVELLGHVQSLRNAKQPSITWIVACTQGKDATKMFGGIPEYDHVILTGFGSVDGMPWVRSMPPRDILPSRLLREPHRTYIADDVKGALKRVGLLVSKGETDRVIIAGSLYLASDVLRLLRDVQTLGN